MEGHARTADIDTGHLCSGWKCYRLCCEKITFVYRHRKHSLIRCCLYNIDHCLMAGVSATDQYPLRTIQFFQTLYQEAWKKGRVIEKGKTYGRSERGSIKKNSRERTKCPSAGDL